MKVFFAWAIMLSIILLCCWIAWLAHRIEVIEDKQTRHCQALFEARNFTDSFWKDFCQVGTNR